MAKRKRNTKGSGEKKAKKAKLSEPAKEDTKVETTTAPPDMDTYPIKETTKDGRKFKFVLWNVAGVRAWCKKEGQKWVFNSDADVICLQETKCEEKKLPDQLKTISGYHCYWNAGEKPGYGGVCLLSKEKPLNVTFGIETPEHSKEGRTITAEYEKYFFVTSYVPNSGRDLVRLDYRKEWDKHFQEYLKNLDEKKPVILCGDLNVSHQEIDLKNPKKNKKNAGFTQEERDGFTELLKCGFVDSFRELYPERTGAYTFWTYMGNCRAKNVGWRLDYFVVSEKMKTNVCDSVIHSDVMGSDHCPISLLLSPP